MTKRELLKIIWDAYPNDLASCSRDFDQIVDPDGKLTEKLEDLNLGDGLFVFLLREVSEVYDEEANWGVTSTTLWHRLEVVEDALQRAIDDIDEVRRVVRLHKKKATED